MKTQWVPGVNNLKSFGRWDFVQVDDLYDLLEWESDDWELQGEE